MLFELIHELAYSQLRTQEQLGYISGARYYKLEKNIVGSIVVQSSKYSVDYLEHRINSFLIALKDKGCFTKEQIENV